jgi:hypothetical protein
MMAAGAEAYGRWCRSEDGFHAAARSALAGNQDLHRKTLSESVSKLIGNQE